MAVGSATQKPPKRTSRYSHEQITLDAHHKRTVSTMSSSEDELEYYVDTGDILFKYYETMKGAEADASTAATTSNPSSGAAEAVARDTGGAAVPSGQSWWAIATAGTGSRIYVQKKAKDTASTAAEPSRLWTRYLQPSGACPATPDSGGGGSRENCRVKLLQQYLRMVDKNYIDDTVPTVPVEVCSHCGSRRRKTMVSEGMIVCDDCSTVEYAITDNDKPSYKEPPKEISYFCYARINHFNEWLNHIQGKETTHIPDELFDSIMLELKKQRVSDMSKLRHQKIRDILKKLKVNKYYEHVPYIINRITGLPNPHLTPQLEERLRNMFKEIQVPYVKHAPPARKNFLSYSFVLYKLLQIEGEVEYLRYFPLLKSRDKLYQQEVIWQKICMETGWPFIRSM